MKPGAALAIIAVGAIMAFAVRVHHSGVFSWQSAGWVLIVAGVAGLLLPYLLPRRQWVRRIVRPRNAHQQPIGHTAAHRDAPSETITEEYYEE